MMPQPTKGVPSESAQPTETTCPRPPSGRRKRQGEPVDPKLVSPRIKPLPFERKKAAKALEEEQEKAAKALEEEQEKAAKALYDERKNGIFNLIATCRHFGISLEMACRQLMKCYHLTQSEAAAYLKEYYV